MRCNNCYNSNFKHTGKHKTHSRFECNSCGFRFNIYNTPEDEIRAFKSAVKRGMSGEDFLYNANKEKK
tara:strand:+ start:521 stop:724 length:204 start_codon:yes stop_codon:yes gene_type:complete